VHRAVLAIALVGVGALDAAAQTAPLPAAAIEDRTGVLTRGAFFLSLAGMETDDPRFSLAARSRADVDMGAYPGGRINFLFDGELVMGSERRRFDLNQANVIFEVSGSYRVGSLELAGVAHHVSRHVVDREFDRVPAWHTIGARATQPFGVGQQSTLAVTLDYGRVVQRTFVDYTWTSQLTVRFETPVGESARVFATGSGGFVGVDRTIANRDTQTGARFEGGVHLTTMYAAAEFFAAYERRVDAYPTSRQPSSWFEVGFRFSTP
jgi:hypothetical protein